MEYYGERVFFMKKRILQVSFILILLSVVIIGYYNIFYNKQIVNRSVIMEPLVDTEIKAIYLKPKHEGRIRDDELKQYKEIITIHTFEELKRYTNKKVAIWIDAKAQELIEPGWQNNTPQAYYPFFFIGSDDAFYVLSDNKSLGNPFQSVYRPDHEGFTVWMLFKDNNKLEEKYSFYKRGFKNLSVENLLNITNYALEGRLPLDKIEAIKTVLKQHPEFPNSPGLVYTRIPGQLHPYYYIDDPARPLEANEEYKTEIMQIDDESYIVTLSKSIINQPPEKATIIKYRVTADDMILISEKDIDF